MSSPCQGSADLAERLITFSSSHTTRKQLAMDALLATVSLTIFLLPCAIQDWRSHQISNWLTLPAFFVAWVVALTLYNLPITIAVFLGCYVAWSMRWMGAADGKVATLVASVAPSALLIGVLLLGLTFLLLRLCRKQQTHLPAIAWFWLGSVLDAVLASAQVEPQKLSPMEWIALQLPLVYAMSIGLFTIAFLWSSLLLQRKVGAG